MSANSQTDQQWRGIRSRILFWMDERQWHFYHCRIYKFWEWVVMPRSWGGRLGFINWCKWVIR